MWVAYTVSCSDYLHIAMDGAQASDVSSAGSYLHFVTLKIKNATKIRAINTTDVIMYFCAWPWSVHFIKHKKAA